MSTPRRALLILGLRTALSHPAMRVQAAACGRGVGSLDEGPTMLVLASPESMDEFSAQFLRYYV